MDDLTQNWSRLTLTDREGLGCRLTTEDSLEDFSIIVKFFMKRALNIDVIERTFNPLWRIISNEPWSFDKHLVVIRKYEKETPVADVKFGRVSFWVQIHGIPPLYMTMEAALKISKVIGVVSRPKEFKEMDGGNFLRLKVSLDLTLPLCRGHLISPENGKQIWISFKYELLPNLYYWCGCLTYDDKDCEIWIDSERTLKPEDRQFGSGLRPPTFI
ncbi:hypothetical protein SO802_003368 [Lithocarpus litseifolius]|uniref:Zinc knuckle CX2CX4HX4C domain-containing protein n=1 Tax=Lithocarpus litseifolius TaxID=425828 RepID=A0AAW2E3P7_9ROSI